MRPWLKLLIEAGPLVVFFAAYSATNLMTATAVFMVAIAVALGASIWIERRVPIMPLVSAAVVMVFGGLTLWLDDDTFIKMKPTIINGLFAAVLFGGLIFRRPFLKPLFGPVLQLDEPGWLKLSLRWAIFFAAVAVLNEIVWRNFSTDNWVTFKVFGILPLTVIFAMAQTPLIQRHSTDPEIRKSEKPAE
ncbi:MAG TPA: septation protein A [Alphaproteobacteria bacterium]|jgi:intracellular septation protein|nr:septation protein A [Alphaproteobacteria bacterium]